MYQRVLVIIDVDDQRHLAGLGVCRATEARVVGAEGHLDAVEDGVVRGAGRATGMGKLITIDHGYGFKTRYGHLSEIKVKKGQRVKRGDIIALMGSTGTPPALTFITRLSATASS